MPAVETKVQRPPAVVPSYRRIVLPMLALVFGLAWFVAIRVVERTRFDEREGASMELAHRVLVDRLKRDQKRLEGDCAVLAYDPRLSAMLKMDSEQTLIEDLIQSMATLFTDVEITVLSRERTLIATSLNRLDEATIRSSSVVSRAWAATPSHDDGVAQLARSGYWITPGPEPQVLEVAVSSVHLGEPLGLVAVTAPMGDVLKEIRTITGVDHAVIVGDEIIHTEPPGMRATFASLTGLVPGAASRVVANDRELVVQSEQLEGAEPTIRVVRAIESSASKTTPFSLLLWAPILGALIFGVMAGRSKP